MLLHEERRDYAAAIAHGQRLLAYDPLHEATYRRLMRLFALSGDRAAALRVYHTCVATLERELGVPPGRATHEAYERLLHADSAHLIPHTVQAPFVGRQAEWQRLQALWRTVSRGALRVVCIQGEAGMGKTRLAEELLHWAQQQGLRTVYARAYASEAGMSYAPLVEILRSPPLQPALALLAPGWRSELARLLPELLEQDPALPAPEPLTESRQRQKLFDALLRAITPERVPLIFVLDDLHWCDGETLAWLLYLVNHGAAARLLLVTTARSEELTPEHPAAGFMTELRGHIVFNELSLPVLDAGETTALAEAIADRKLDAAQAQQLFAATEGNPLFIVETMHSLAGQVDRVPCMLVLPPKVQTVMRGRLARLSPSARELAGLAATMGRSFRTDVLIAATELTEEAVVRGLDELWQRRIVREQGTNSYDFSHDRLREVAYGELQPAQRRLLHRRVAAALEQSYADASGALTVQLAHHCDQGGLVEKAIHYLQQAAVAARQLYAHREAIAYTERAIGLLQSQPASGAALERELELQMDLCQDWCALTFYMGDEAKAVYDRALVLCRQLAFTPHLFTVYWGLHGLALCRGDYAESLELSRHCLRIAEELGNPDLLLEAHHAMWGSHFYLGTYEQAFEHMTAGLALYDPLRHERLSTIYGAHDTASCALTEFPLALWSMGYPDQARSRLDAAIAQSHSLLLPANVADADSYVALACHLLRDPVRARQYAEPALKIFDQLDLVNARYLATVTLGWSQAMQGQTEEGVALAYQGVSLFRKMGHSLHVTQLSCMLAEACMAGGYYQEAVVVLEAALADFARSRDLLLAPDLHLLRGDALLALGAEETELECCYSNGLLLAQKLHAKVSELRAAMRIARLRQRQGQPPEGRAVLLEIYSWFTEGLDTPDLLAARALLEELAATLPGQAPGS